MDTEPAPELTTLRQELLKALRRTAFDTYVHLDGRDPRAERDAEGLVFADEVVKAITPDVFCNALQAAVRAAARRSTHR